MEQKKRIRKLRIVLLAVFLTASLLAATGYGFWAADDSDEKHLLKKGLPGIVKSRNSKAIKKIQEAVKDKSSFKFAVVGDTHDDFEKFKRIVDEVVIRDPDFIIHTGDFTCDGRLDEYRKTLNFIDRIKTPFIVAAGNHDMDNNGPQLFSSIFGPPNFYFDLQGRRLIFLNNVRRDINSDIENITDAHPFPGLSRGVDKQTISSIERLLQEQEGRAFLIMHMPPPLKPFDYHSFSRNGSCFIDMVTRNAPKIAAVIFSHIHGYHKMVSEKVPYILAGGAGDPQEQEGENITYATSYVLITVAEQQIKDEVFFLDSLRLAHAVGR